MTAPTLTCDTCDSEIDTAKDPRCVMYDPSGATDHVICEGCRRAAYDRWVLRDGPAGVGDLNLPKADQRGCEAYRIKRGWSA